MHYRQRVALIYGGRGFEREVSLMGEKAMRPIIEKFFDCLPVLIEKDGGWLYNGRTRVVPAKVGNDSGFFAPNTGEFIPVDCAFLLLHGDFGEDGVVQGMLEGADTRYIGCKTKTSAICRDKAVLKCVARELNIPTLPYITAWKGEDAVEMAERHIGYPMFVKPTCLGSSIGCSPAEDREKLIEALEKAFAVSDRVIIEKLIRPKRELECGYFATKSKELFTDVGEIITYDEFYDYDGKYKSEKTNLAVSADVPREVQEKIKEYSRRLVKFLGIRQMSRIDFFLSGDRIYFNEINTIPGMTKGSLYPKMLEAAGIVREKFVEMLILDTLSGG